MEVRGREGGREEERKEGGREGCRRVGWKETGREGGEKGREMFILYT